MFCTAITDVIGGRRWRRRILSSKRWAHQEGRERRRCRPTLERGSGLRCDRVCGGGHSTRSVTTKHQPACCLNHPCGMWCSLAATSCSERAGGRSAVPAFTFHSEARGGGRKTVPAKQQAARGCSWRRTNGGHRIRRAGGEQEDSSVGWAAVLRLGESCMQTSLARTKWSDKRHLKESQELQI